MSSHQDNDPDSLYNTDERYHLTETDAQLVFAPESFGTRRIGIALIGVGRMGAIHLYNTLREPRAKLLYIFDADKKRLAYLRQKYFLDERGVKVASTEDFQTIMDDKEVEAVFITTPTYTHEHYCKASLQAGKHVLCEKPLAESLSDVKAIVDTAKAKNLKLICAFNRRYDPSFRRIKDQIKRGVTGPVRIVKTCSRDSPEPPYEYVKTSGGIFHDCSVHDIDSIIFLVQEMPIEVTTSVHCHDEKYAQLNDYDTAVITMKFPSGCMSVTDLSRVSNAGYEQRVEVFGHKAVLKIDELSRVGWERHNEKGITKLNQCFSFASRYMEAYSREIVELFNHIEGNKTLEPICHNYLPALCKVINACVESTEKKQPVKLTWTEEELAGCFPS